jgi:hypothetical protein
MLRKKPYACVLVAVLAVLLYKYAIKQYQKVRKKQKQKEKKQSKSVILDGMEVATTDKILDLPQHANSTPYKHTMSDTELRTLKVTVRDKIVAHLKLVIKSNVTRIETRFPCGGPLLIEPLQDLFDEAIASASTLIKDLPEQSVVALEVDGVASRVSEDMQTRVDRLIELYESSITIGKNQLIENLYKRVTDMYPYAINCEEPNVCHALRIKTRNKLLTDLNEYVEDIISERPDSISDHDTAIEDEIMNTRVEEHMDYVVATAPYTVSTEMRDDDLTKPVIKIEVMENDNFQLLF